MDWCRSMPDRNWGWFVASPLSGKPKLNHFSKVKAQLSAMTQLNRPEVITCNSRYFSLESSWEVIVKVLDEVETPSVDTFEGAHLDVTGPKTHGSHQSTLETHFPGFTCFEGNLQFCCCFIRNVHELPVDAFVYENCSVNVDTMTEFCTGAKQLTVLSPFRSCLWRHSDNKRQDGSLHLQSVQRDRRRCWRGGEKSVQQDGTASQDVPPRRHLLEWQQDHHKVGWEAPRHQSNHGGLSGKGQGTRVVHIQALKATGCNLILSQDSWHNWSRQKMHWHKIDKWTNPVALGMPVGRCGSSMSSGCLFCSAPLEARIINHWIKTKTVKQEHKPSLTVMQGNKPI